MTDIVKVVTDGDLQTVQLPNQYHIDADEMEISRIGDMLVLKPRGSGNWQRLNQILNDFDQESFDDCFPGGREQPTQQERPELDDLLG